MIEAKSCKEAPTYCPVVYVSLSLLVSYKILAEARITIPTENQSPRLNPKIAPATISPIEINPPIIIMFLRNEKSFLDVKATADKPANIAIVSMAA